MTTKIKMNPAARAPIRGARIFDVELAGLTSFDTSVDEEHIGSLNDCMATAHRVSISYLMCSIVTDADPLMTHC